MNTQITGQITECPKTQRFLEWLSQELLKTTNPDDVHSEGLIKDCWIDVSGSMNEPVLTIRTIDPRTVIFDRLRKEGV